MNKGYQHCRFANHSFIAKCLAISVFLFAGHLTAHASFIDTPVDTTTEWAGTHWVIKPLKIEDSADYYTAYQSSAKYLYEVLGWGWPTRKISPAVNADMVRHHVSQHEEQLSFTYVIRNKASSAIAGAIYVNPVNPERRHIPNFNAGDYAAEVTFWFTEETEASEQVDSLLKDVFQWVENEWALSSVLIPVNKNYLFIQQQMATLEYKSFSEDSDSGELLYRLP